MTPMRSVSMTAGLVSEWGNREYTISNEKGLYRWLGDKSPHSAPALTSVKLKPFPSLGPVCLQTLPLSDIFIIVCGWE